MEANVAALPTNMSDRVLVASVEEETGGNETPQDHTTPGNVLHSGNWNRQKQPRFNIPLKYSAVSYSVVNFSQILTKYVHPINHQLGPRYGMSFVAPNSNDALPQSLQWCMPYHVILDGIIMAPNWLYW